MKKRSAIFGIILSLGMLLSVSFISRNVSTNIGYAVSKYYGDGPGYVVGGAAAGAGAYIGAEWGAKLGSWGGILGAAAGGAIGGL